MAEIPLNSLHMYKIGSFVCLGLRKSEFGRIKKMNISIAAIKASLINDSDEECTCATQVAVVCLPCQQQLCASCVD